MSYSTIENSEDSLFSILCYSTCINLLSRLIAAFLCFFLYVPCVLNSPDLPFSLCFPKHFSRPFLFIAAVSLYFLSPLKLPHFIYALPMVFLKSDGRNASLLEQDICLTVWKLSSLHEHFYVIFSLNRSRYHMRIGMDSCEKQ